MARSEFVGDNGGHAQVLDGVSSFGDCLRGLIDDALERLFGVGLTPGSMFVAV